MSALFLGLILGSIWVALRMLDRIDGIADRPHARHRRAPCSSCSDCAPTPRSPTIAAEVVTESWWVFFLAGAIAICAMILPGISGSFILVMLGMYTEVLGAVNDRDFPC